VPDVWLELQEASGMTTRAVGGIIQAVTNTRGETIEAGFIVTVVEAEHHYGTGEVKGFAGKAGGVHFAAVEWDSGRGTDWLLVDELTNINLNRRDRTLQGGGL
jgi:hypothetical protein